MQLDFSSIPFDKDGRCEIPELMVQTLDGRNLGVLAGVTGLSIHPKFTEISTMSFDIAAMLDGDVNPTYDLVTGHRLIYTECYGVYEIMNPSEDGDGISLVKHVEAYSVEKLLENKRFFIEEGTYRFWNPATPSETILGRILEKAPDWQIGYVSSSLWDQWRTFDQYDDYLLSFIYNDMCDKYRCAVSFEPYADANTGKRTINIYDADAEVTAVPIYLDYDNLITNLKVDEKSDELITALRPYGADELDIRDVNPTGAWLYDLTNFIGSGDIPDSLAAKWRAWESAVSAARENYIALTDLRALRTSELLAKQVERQELVGKRETFEIERNTVIQAEASGLSPTRSLADIKADVDAVDLEIEAVDDEIEDLEAQLDPAVTGSIAAQIKAIVDALAITNTNNFTLEEQAMLQRYMIEQDLQEDSFVASDVGSTVAGQRMDVTGCGLDFTDAEITYLEDNDIYRISGGDLSVQPLPDRFEILQQPVDNTVWRTDSTTTRYGYFNVSVSVDVGVTYQWQWRSSPSETWANITGTVATRRAYDISATAARNGYQYRCAITKGGETIYSDTATFTTTTTEQEFGIIRQPIDYTGYVGETMKFIVCASGSPTYQWQRYNGTSWVNSTFSGNTTPVLSGSLVTRYDGYTYRCKLTYHEEEYYTDPVVLHVVTYDYAVERGTLEVYNDNGTDRYTASVYLHDKDSESVISSGGVLIAEGVLPSPIAALGDPDEYGHNDLTVSGGAGSLTVSSSYSLYQRYAVQQQLLAFAQAELADKATKTYEFSVDSGNFVWEQSFAPFRNALALGKGVYLNVNGRKVVAPLIELELNFNDQSSFSVLCSNRFKRADHVATLKDMIEKSYSSSRSFDAGKYTQSLVTAQANEVADFMSSSLDAAKNRIIGAANQSVRIDASGIHIGETSGTYQNYQLGIANNMIAMTDDNWSTAKLAIGYFQTPDNGSYFGINAEVIAGKLIVGSEMIIENKNAAGTVTQFRVDGSGAWLENSRLALVSSGGGQLLLDPENGIVAGKYNATDGNLFTVSGTSVTESYLDANDDPKPNVSFWLDINGGDAYFAGTLMAKAGEIGGFTIAANELSAGTSAATSVGLSGAATGTNATYAFWAGNSAPASAPFSVTKAGKLKAADIDVTGGSIKIGGTDQSPNFHVDASGNLTTAGGLTLGGSINMSGASSITWGNNNPAAGCINASDAASIASTVVSQDLVASPTIVGASIYGGTIYAGSSSTTYNRTQLDGYWLKFQRQTSPGTWSDYGQIGYDSGSFIIDSNIPGLELVFMSADDIHIDPTDYLVLGSATYGPLSSRPQQGINGAIYFAI